MTIHGGSLTVKGMRYFLLLCTLLLVSCGASRYTVTSFTVELHSFEAVDSVCRVERISSDLSTWSRLGLLDAASGDSIIQWFYVVDTSKMRGPDAVYILTSRGDSCFVFEGRRF